MGKEKFKPFELVALRVRFRMAGGANRFRKLLQSVQEAGNGFFESMINGYRDSYLEAKKSLNPEEN